MVAIRLPVGSTQSACMRGAVGTCNIIYDVCGMIDNRKQRWTCLVRQCGGLAKVDRVGFYAANCSVISAVA
jgi:hypothetical protein